MNLLFATANAHKCQEARTILGSSISIIMPSSMGFTAEIPETGLTLEENALQKALFIWNTFHLPCFADDTGLEVDGLDGAPGVFSARYAGPSCTPADNVRKLLEEMKDMKDRTARFRCVIALIRRGEPVLFQGIVQGSILYEPVGTGGFGYDPVFRPEGYDTSFAQMTEKEKNHISHRKRALEIMALQFT
ncbi:MAG: RdgB/HAM1 family non-canonical purine NTP pyrophosphatase [Bacteroidales bacterium]|jgi:XTP/dITP diphosphohydrolase|nr:RdgB/HAM1 family non-canonical purine NTP pyrophosphatase [Bacteroidales bacterium]MDD2823865.1 RdgB/HAM1 family non-canonical purine NTP pyrophosphatase [Bacteroidales bacterium]MDD3100336.1 RdgB/HAM1 family non-canonical purine NTP pyrophosphatase [Bacteroidales bacterium]MDD3639215.1 RdgB/HAM1 family non-canonical purine NTP pyrophosphatase [Bacteroidales bacterium]MDD3943906.1 RdgB/HAM1 family non-canonical purine NTP pyrophosphatase [Bacteroidales bacterium]